MINELYQLSEAMELAGITAGATHDKYLLLPNVTAKAPCVRITIENGKVLQVSEIDAKLAATLRKYGSNQGSYPCMNLTPLYRVTDVDARKMVSAVTPENLTDSRIQKLRELCVHSNWDANFKKKYRISFEKVTAELKAKVPEYQPLEMLMNESSQFLNPDKMHAELGQAAFQMLAKKENIALALLLLFYCYDPDKDKVKEKNKTKNISVALETPALIELGIPAVSGKFVRELNQALLIAEGKNQAQAEGVDAYEKPFVSTDAPMPKVKLAGGITPILRTMFAGQPCQTRYGRIEGGSYPLSEEMRKRLKSALEWIGGPEQKHKTWINTDRGEILFVYPSKLPENDVSFVDLFGGNENNDIAFLDLSKQFLAQTFHYRKDVETPDPEWMQIFILRKIDNGRTKVVYTRQTNPGDLEKCGIQWDAGCKNIPSFCFGKPKVPYPLDIAATLNHFWKSDGTLATDKYRPIPRYHGIELLLDPEASTVTDLRLLVQKAYVLGPFLGSMLPRNGAGVQLVKETKAIIALLGCVLYRNGIRKDIYMEKLPYLYGQLLKVSDELHMLYCKIERKENYPAQFVGSTMYQAAIDAPVRTLNLLGQRMRPYIAWAKTYGGASAELKKYGTLGNKLSEELSENIHFTDLGKAQFFLGYLADFPNNGKNTEAQDK